MTAASAVTIAPQTASIPRGIAAGAIACLVALPVTPVAWFVATIMKRTLYRKSISYDELHQHARGYLITDAVVAGATGLIAGGIAALAALTLVKHGRRGAFQSTAGTGATVAALLAWRAATLHGDPAGSATLAIVMRRSTGRVNCLIRYGTDGPPPTTTECGAESVGCDDVGARVDQIADR